MAGFRCSMTPTELRTIGEALWGERWQTSLAQAVGVSSRTVRRWLAGSWPVPVEIQAALGSLARDRIERLHAIIA